MSALLKKGTGEKDAVVSLNIKVAVTLPANFDSGSMPNETSLAGARGNKEISGHVVYAVVQALPSPEYPVSIGIIDSDSYNSTDLFPYIDSRYNMIVTNASSFYIIARHANSGDAL